jgi:hypothetical protein
MSAPGRVRSAPRAGARPSAVGWLPVTALLLSVLGLADSAYQTYTHYSGAGLLGCSATGDPCVLVQHSAEAYAFGIPGNRQGQCRQAGQVRRHGQHGERKPLAEQRRGAHQRRHGQHRVASRGPAPGASSRTIHVGSTG